jgi:hypothetical protein
MKEEGKIKTIKCSHADCSRKAVVQNPASPKLKVCEACSKWHYYFKKHPNAKECLWCTGHKKSVV